MSFAVTANFLKARIYEFQSGDLPACGGALQVPEDRSTVKCMYCGIDVIVRGAIHAAAVGSINNWLELARAAVESGNHQEAYTYFSRP